MNGDLDSLDCGKFGQTSKGSSKFDLGLAEPPHNTQAGVSIIRAGRDDHLRVGR
jgi:hypothetical protein